MELSEIRQQIQKKIADADMVLVGIGKELDTDRKDTDDKETISEFEVKEKILREVSDDQGVLDQEFFQRGYSVQQKEDGKIRNAGLFALKQMLEGKNYFVISTNTDECLYQTGFRYLVTPCGRESLFQCSENCSDMVWESRSYWDEMLLKPDVERILPKCPVCGARADFNIIKTNRRTYCETGYLPAWNQYMKWLSGTLNKKLLLLDFGSDFVHPQLIRWAFERTAMLNQKAFLIRVHKTLFSIPDELKERSYSFAEDCSVLLGERQKN